MSISGIQDQQLEVTEGGKNPVFHDKLVFTIIEGREEIQVDVWNSNTFSSDDHIGSARVSLSKVLEEGHDDSIWPLQCKNGRFAGEIKLILHYRNTNKHATNLTTSFPSHPPPSAPPQSQSCAPAQQPPSAYPEVVCPCHISVPAYPPPPAPVSGYYPAAYAPQPRAVYYQPPYTPATYPSALYPGAVG